MRRFLTVIAIWLIVGGVAAQADYLGSWKIDDLLTFSTNTHNAGTGAEVDADSAPTYRIYEDETTTPIVTGTMALLDAANTNGFYSEQITLSAANGFEKGKSYTIRTSETVATVAMAKVHNFQIGAVVDEEWINGDATAADNLDDAFDEAGGSGVDMALDSLAIIGSGDCILLLSTGADGNGINATGNGAGSGFTFTGGATGNGGSLAGPTYGLRINSTSSGVGHALFATGGGSGSGIQATGGTTGDGINAAGGATGGDGMELDGDDTGDDLKLTGGDAPALFTTLASGTAQSGTASTIVLAAASAFANDELLGDVIQIASGTGAGQSRVIIDYVSSSDTATVTPDWTTTPGAASVYQVVPGSTNITAVAGSAASVSTAGVGTTENLQTTTIATLASQTSFTLTAGSVDNDAYNRCKVIVTDATTATQKAVGRIADYVGSTRTVTLVSNPGVFTMAAGDAISIIADPLQGGPYQTAQVPPARTLQVKSGGDGTWGVVGRVRMPAGAGPIWWAVNLAGTHLSPGDVVDSLAAPTAGGAQAANITVADYGVQGTKALIKLTMSGSAATTDTITLPLSITMENDEVITLTVNVTVVSGG